MRCYIVRATDDEPQSYGRFETEAELIAEVAALGLAAEEWILVEINIDGTLSFYSLYDWLETEAAR